jgi:hypothetical protein
VLWCSVGSGAILHKMRLYVRRCLTIRSTATCSSSYVIADIGSTVSEPPELLTQFVLLDVHRSAHCWVEDVLCAAGDA